MGYNTIFLDETDSTNEHLFRLAEQGVPDRTLLIARRQSAGKGSRNRSFFSPAGGLYMSLLLRSYPTEQLPLLTPLAAVAVWQALCPHTDKKLYIKWVNDIYAENGKLCGILTQTRWQSEAVTVVGIGINLVAQDFPAGFSHPPTYLLPAENAQIRQQITEDFCRYFEQLQSKDFMKIYRSVCCTVGKQVTLQKGNDIISGTAVGITDSGALQILTAEGTCEFASGEVTSQTEEYGI